MFSFLIVVMFCLIPVIYRLIQDFQPLLILSVKYFTVDHGSEVCTLSFTPGKNIHIILSALY